MKVLLDTHIFLALIKDGAASLPATVAALLGDSGAEHHLSAASLWEIAIKHRLGKLKLGLELDTLPELLNGLGVKIVSIDERHALASVEPEPVTRDPFDRMLLAQCQVEGLRLVTIDRALTSHPLAVRG
ncbi:MAG TPA: type II toxin-antitoxin system VapC family toxin [Roseiarcus sp.]|jgi:PIN domain nuclease of toxin-antitoxin system